MWRAYQSEVTPPTTIAGMRFVVETWDPAYGSPVRDHDLDASSQSVDATVEYPLHQWRPITPPDRADPMAVPIVSFVDGVRRIDARLWIDEPDGRSRPGVCASVAAGAVRWQIHFDAEPPARPARIKRHAAEGSRVEPLRFESGYRASWMDLHDRMTSGKLQADAPSVDLPQLEAVRRLTAGIEAD